MKDDQIKRMVSEILDAADEMIFWMNLDIYFCLEENDGLRHKCEAIAKTYLDETES